MTRDRFSPRTMALGYLCAYEDAMAAHAGIGELVLLSGKGEPGRATADDGEGTGTALGVDTAGAVGES